MFNKIAVTQLSPFYLASIRFFIAGILMIFISLIAKHKLSITKKQFVNSLIVAFFFLIYGNGVYIWALKFVDSGFAALIASTQPLFVLCLLRLIDRKPFQRKSIIGVALGIIGMYLLVNQHELITSKEILLGVFMMLTCVFSWSYGSVFVSKADLPKSYIVSSGYQMIIASLVLFLMSLSFNETWLSPTLWTNDVILSVVVLIIFGGIVAFTAFNYLLKKVPTEKVSTSAYVNPVIALILGWMFLDETLSTQSIIASIILLSGVYFITSRKRR